MAFALLVLFVLASGVLTAWLLSHWGVRRGWAVSAGAATVVASSVLFVALALVHFGECLAENRDPPPPFSYPWSPRREFCDDGSTAQLGVLVSFLIPPVLVIGGSL